MRTLRELSGWALVLLLWILPVLTVVTGIVWLDRSGVSVGWPLAALLALTTWPSLRRFARRLRDPAPAEVAEADGRAPVLLVHRFERVASPFWARLSALAPASRRDARDHRWEHAITRGLSAAGPVMPFARPAPPPAFGPVRALSRGAWDEELERRLKTSRLAAIVLDETDACAHAVERAAAVLGRRRLILVMPARIDAALEAAWPRLMELLPGLTPFDRRVVAIRFDREGRPLLLTSSFAAPGPRRQLLRAPSVMLFAHEPRPAPRAPSASWVLSALPVLAALAAAVLAPLLLDAQGVRVTGKDGLVLAGGVIALGVTLAVLSRRAFALVPANELPMLVVASLSWFAFALALWIDGDWRAGSYDLARWLEATAVGAAYAAPLLFATALVLAGSALVRRSPRRSAAHAVFGVAALIPLATLVVSLSAARIPVGLGVLVLALAAIPVALAAAAASGDAGRPHAPIPLGAAAAGVLTVAAWATVLTSARWREMIRETSVTALVESARGAAALARFDGAVVFAALAIPAVVVAIASLFSGRASRVSVGNIAALAPLIVLFGLFATAHAAARVCFTQAYLRSDATLLMDAFGAHASSPGARELHPVEIEYGAPPRERVQAVLTRWGAFVDGVPLPDLYATPQTPPTVARAVGRAVARRPEEPFRIAVGAASDSRGLRHLTESVFLHGAQTIELVGQRFDGSASAIRVRRMPAPRRRGEAWIRLFVVARANGITLAATDGTMIPIEGHDLARLRELLRDRRAQEPNRRDLILSIEDGISGSIVMGIADAALGEGYDDLMLSDGRP